MKILAVCGFGVGSSMILRMSVEKALKDLGLEGTVENTDVSSAQGAQVDYIFTSEELAAQLRNSVSCPVIPIHRYMDKEEVKTKLQEYLN